MFTPSFRHFINDLRAAADPLALGSCLSGHCSGAAVAAGEHLRGNDTLAGRPIFVGQCDTEMALKVLILHIVE